MSPPPETLDAAIADYHGCLEDGLAGESWQQLEEQMRRRDLFFGERPLCTVLRPRFLLPDQYLLLQRRMGSLLGAFRAAHERALRDTAFRAQFRLQDWEETLALEESGFEAYSPVARMDAFMSADGTGFQVTEYNAETPAGAGYGDVLAEVFLALPVMREFLKRWELRPLPARHHVLHALIDSYRQWSGRRDTPRIAILDWDDVPTHAEFRISAEYFRAQGVPAVIGHPDAVDYRDGGLYLDGERIDLVYKRVLLHELVERGGLEHPLVRAVRDGAVCMVNPFRCKILHKKASLAVLSDERNEGLFDARQRKAIDAHVPWTRVVEERRTRHQGRDVDLLEHVAERRDRFVLKPNDEYGGKGIVLGWEVDESTWRSALKAALDRPSVVQERIELPTEPYPALVDGELRIEDRIVDTAPYAFDARYIDGCLTRLSTESLVNVTAGGGSSLATFTIGARH